MELHGVEAARFVCNGGEWGVVADGDDFKSCGQCGDAVTVAHPNLMAFARFPDTVEQRTGLAHFEHRAAELTVVAPLDFSAELFGHGLLAVTDAKHGYAGIEHGVWRARALRFDHRGRAAGENDGSRL